MFFAKSKKILIVEDDKSVAALLLANIEALDCAVFVAYDGETGWEIAKEECQDLVIQDLGLPKMTGIALCKLIKSDVKTSHARVIMLTGNQNVGDMEDCFRAGADAYVNKPFDWDHVLRHIRKFLPAVLGEGD